MCPTRSRTNVRALVSRVLVYTHRWLGIGLGVLFAGWFVSGVVLMYVGMPSLTPEEHLARSAALDFSSATVAPPQLASLAGQPVDALRLAMVAGRPVYRLRAGGRTLALFADTGTPVGPLDADAAVAIARTFAPERSSTLQYDARLDTPDQWTLETARQLPMHRVALGDPDDTRLYISESTGDVLLKTTRQSRRWAYPGAILHWIYLTPIRRYSEAWAQFIVWTSVAGTVMTLAGLVWGIWRVSPRARYRLQKQPRYSPYSGWMRWHHYAGLIFGVATLTWIFSGLLSMDPWDWHPGTAPTPEQRRAFAGGAMTVDRLSLAALGASLSAAGPARDAEVLQTRGELWLATDRTVVPLTGARDLLPLAEDAVRELAAQAMPAARVASLTRLTSYDAYYYDRGGALPLPVYRITYDDPVQSWLYVDVRRGTLLRKEERLTRLNRWLYHGLHSLDFPFLYYRRPLWDIVVVALSAGGLALTLTPLIAVYRRGRRHFARIIARS